MCIHIHIQTHIHIHITKGTDTMEELTRTGSTALQTEALTEDLQERFIRYLDASPKTVKTYGGALRQFFRWTHEHGITQPVREDIIAYREDLKLEHKATTVQNYIIAVRLFFQWTEQEGLYPDIAKHIKGAKLSKEHKKDYLSSSQVKGILENIDTSTAKGRRDYALFALMVTGGLRDIEASRANIEDLRTLGDNTVLYLQGKGRTERAEYVKITPPVERALRASLADRASTDGTQPLFISLSNNSKGERMTTRSISGSIKAQLIKAGYNSDRLTAHSLRHTAVTLSLLGGNSLQEVQQFARHANIATTQIYAHNLDRAKNQCENTIAEAIF